VAVRDENERRRWRGGARGFFTDPRQRPWFWTWDGHSSIPTSLFVWILTILGAVALGVLMSWQHGATLG